MEAIAERRAPRRMRLRPLRAVSDEQLAELIADGDGEAFAVAYDRHRAAILRYCRGILVSAEDAEDAAQSAMLSALRTLPERPPQVMLRAWLFRVAHNEAISMLRRRRQHASLDQAMHLATDDVAEAAASRARLRALVADLQSLPERQRGALVMRELCGLGYGDIAGALGGSEGAAMQSVFEARSALAQFDQGRSMSCESVQRCISDGDRRRLRARRLRAHVRGCDQCRAFERTLTVRRRDLAVLAPVAGKAGLAALAGLLGGGGGLRVLGGSQLVPPGLRAAAVGALLVTAGGGVAAEQLVSPAGAPPGRAAASARFASATAGPSTAPPGARPHPAAGIAGESRVSLPYHRLRAGQLTAVAASRPPAADPPLATGSPAPAVPIAGAPTTAVAVQTPQQTSSVPAPGAGASPQSVQPTRQTQPPTQPSSVPVSWPSREPSGAGAAPDPQSPTGAAATASPVRAALSGAVKLLQGLLAACIPAQLGPFGANVGPGCRS